MFISQFQELYKTQLVITQPFYTRSKRKLRQELMVDDQSRHK